MLTLNHRYLLHDRKNDQEPYAPELLLVLVTAVRPDARLLQLEWLDVKDARAAGEPLRAWFSELAFLNQQENQAPHPIANLHRFVVMEDLGLHTPVGKAPYEGPSHAYLRELDDEKLTQLKRATFAMLAPMLSLIRWLLFSLLCVAIAILLFVHAAYREHRDLREKQHSAAPLLPTLKPGP